MVEYDPDKRIYVEPATGSFAKFKQVELRESWIAIDFVWSSKPQWVESGRSESLSALSLATLPCSAKMPVLAHACDVAHDALAAASIIVCKAD